jgi:hypothetical protein
MGFEQAYLNYLELHAGQSNGERRRRLEDGLGHGEKLFLQRLWWSGFGNFNHLHPEYVVSDERGRSRFVDFAYIYSWFKIAFEIQGYGPHLKQASRWSYADEQQRIRFLSSTGWTLMYFSYDEIKDSPEGCLQEIQSLLGRLIGRDSGGLTLSPVEKEIIRMAISRKGMIHAHDIYGEMNLHRNTVYRYLRSLVKQGWLEPAGDRYNIEYHLNPHKKHLF